MIALLLSLAAAATLPAAVAAAENATPASTAAAVPSGFLAQPRTAREDWAAAKARAAATPEWTTWLLQQRQLVDVWMGRKPERADLIGGWVHDYVDTKTGVPAKWTESSPEPPDEGSAAGTRFKQAWVANMRQRNITNALIAARLYKLTDEPRYGQWAAAQLDFYAANYAKWPVRTRSGRGAMFTQGLDEAYAVFSLLDVARLTSELAGPARVRTWHDALFLPMAENLKTVTYAGTNQSVWYSAARAAIAMRMKDAAALNAALNGPQQLRPMLAVGVTADDVWFEGTFAYNAYVIDALSELLTFASLEGQADSFGPEWQAMQRLLTSPLAFRFDDGYLPSPGDTRTRMLAINDRAYTQVFRLLPSVAAVQRASLKPNWDLLIDPPAQVPAAAPELPPVTTRNFEAVRMAVLKAGPWQAFVHYGQARASHAQEEALSYELYHGSVAISTDSGTVDYSSQYHKDYFRRGPAHNAALVDGEGQRGWKPGEVVAFSAQDASLTALQPSYRPNTRVQRSYQLGADSFVETTEIQLSGPAAAAPHRLGIVFHTDCKLESTTGTTEDGAAPALPRNEATAYWKPEQTLRADRSWTARLLCGKESFQVQFQAPGPQQVYMLRAPHTPLPATRQSIYLEVQGTEARFETRIVQAK